MKEDQSEDLYKRKLLFLIGSGKYSTQMGDFGKLIHDC